MEVVVNTAPYIYLCKIGKLDLLDQLYEKIYTPDGVRRELEFPEEAVKFLDANCIVKGVDENNIKEWASRLDLTGAEIEVFLLYCETSADEMLFANKKAKERIGKYGKVRDIIELKDLAEEMDIYDKSDSKGFLDLLKSVGYRPKDVNKELEKYR